MNRFVITALLMGSGAVSALDFGSHTLPDSLAATGALVQGVVNKDPGNASRSLGYCEGPAVDARGNLFFTEQAGANAYIWKSTSSGAASQFFFGPAYPNGLEFDPQGRLISCEKNGATAYDSSGTGKALAMTGNPAPDLKQLNDLSIASDGGMFFTNHNTGNTFFYRSPAGVVTAYPNSGPLGVLVPNGIEYVEEKKLLFVNSTDGNKVYQFDVGADRTVSNRREFAAMSYPDGLTLDEHGNVYVASYMEGAIHVFNATGTLLGKITVTGDATPSGNTSNCVFGGPDRKTLYITGDGGCYKIQMKIAGRTRPASVALVPELGPSALGRSHQNSVARKFDSQGRRLGHGPSSAVSRAKIRVFFDRKP